jgi:subtilisin family serine protease
MFGAAVVVALVTTLVGPVAPAAAESTGRYIVLTSSAGTAQQKADKLRSAKAPIGRQFRTALHGFSAKLTETQARQLRDDVGVEAVVPDTRVRASDLTASTVGQESNAPWGLDRVDQRSGRDGRYFYNSTGAGVTAYVIDTGIRMDHSEFALANGQSRARGGYDFVDHDADAGDCPSNYADDLDTGAFSHGTHVAATIAGKTYGIAKQASVVSVRVLDCEGSGTASDVVAALDWVVGQHPSGPSVVNFSLGGPQNEAIDDAVAATIAAGIPVVAAGGNDDQNACWTSPAGAPGAITVGATDIADERAYFSNYGSCVDLFAPGVNIKSAGSRTTSASLLLSGTSMASPHVTGAVARYLETHPSATPAQVGAAITSSATGGVVGDRAGSPDRLLYLYSPKTASAPTSVTANRSDKAKTATVGWVPPKTDGGMAVTGYRLIRTGKDAAGRGSVSVDVAAGARTYTFAGLKAGTTYTLSVQGRNPMGLGSAASIKTTITALPGKPKITSAKSGSTRDKKTSVYLKWSRPASGGAVKHYVITATRTTTGSVKTVTASSSSRSATIKGLKKNARYVLRVRATNDSGNGATSKWAHSVKAR